MELNDLETKFFERILNAELDVPVPATLQYEGHDFDLIVVPEIAPKGYFRMKYYNAPTYEPEADGNGITSMSLGESFGRHPLLGQAYQNRDPVELQLRPSPMPLGMGKANPKLDAKVLFANYGHRGELVLNNNQVKLNDFLLKKAEFSLFDFTDFITAERQLASIAGFDEADRQILQNIANKLEDGAKLTISPTRPRVVLDSGDGWKVTLSKDEKTTRDSISHTGVIERNDGAEFSTNTNELGNVLEALRYFFAFVMGGYRFMSAIIGYDAHGVPVYGRGRKI